MPELVEFLRARFDEDEHTARAATPAPWRHGLFGLTSGADLGTARFEDAVFAGPTGHDAVRVAGTGEVREEQTAEDAIHIARHGPARVLAEVAAKKQILDEHICPCPEPDCGDCGACSGEHHADPTTAPCRTVRLLALTYADHPDYREEWRP